MVQRNALQRLSDGLKISPRQLTSLNPRTPIPPTSDVNRNPGRYHAPRICRFGPEQCLETLCEFDGHGGWLTLIVSGEDSCDNSRARARLTRLRASVGSRADICSSGRLQVDQIGRHRSLYSSKRSALSCTMELSVLYLIRPGLSLSLSIQI